MTKDAAGNLYPRGEFKTRIFLENPKPALPPVPTPGKKCGSRQIVLCVKKTGRGL